jgi:hypothetical protein
MSEIVKVHPSAKMIADGVWSLPETSTEFVLGNLTSMGRVMVIASDNGVTHERIGNVEDVSITGSSAELKGVAQDCVIDLSPIAKLTLDLTSVMKDKSFPRLNFMAQDDKVLFAIVGFDGKEPFVTPFLNEVRKSLPPEEKQNSEKSELDENDPRYQPFKEALESKKTVTIQMRANNITQRWQGVVEKIVPAMGFLNIMTGDFHLHLKGGAVSKWKQEKNTFIALGEGAEEIGLNVEFIEQ